MTASVAGGVGSVIAGGRFENRAVTDAFGYVFNEVASAMREEMRMARNRFLACSGTINGHSATELAVEKLFFSA